MKEFLFWTFVALACYTLLDYWFEHAKHQKAQIDNKSRKEAVIENYNLTPHEVMIDELNALQARFDTLLNIPEIKNKTERTK